jgi:hypothetical protein
LVKYRVHVPVSRDLKPTFDHVAPPEPATDSMKFLIAAKAAAIKAAAPFVQPVNPAIFRGDDFGEPGGVLVELIAGTNRHDTVVLGKHVRVVVGSDGAVRSVKALSNGVLEVPTREGEKRPKALFVSEVVDDYPLEIHVFASMSSHLPLYVTNARGLWFVDGDQITFLGKQHSLNARPCPAPRRRVSGVGATVTSRSGSAMRISARRRVTHPAVKALQQAARSALIQ